MTPTQGRRLTSEPGAPGAGRAHGRVVRIAFPIWCVYHGGHRVLGEHGRNLWIADGRIGTGLDQLRFGIPLEEVTGVEVVDRPARAGVPRLAEVTVRTADGQAARWAVHQRDAAWVRERLAAVLAHAGVPVVAPGDW